MRTVLVVQAIATGLYLFISMVDGIVARLLSDPRGYYVMVTPYINLSQIIHAFQTSLTLPTMSSLYTMSVFEILILANIVVAFRSGRGFIRTKA